MTEIETALSADQARRLTERIRLTATAAAENIDKLKTLVAQAKDGSAHIALGYASWQAYLADVLGDTPMRLERDVRPGIIAELAAEGMSNRAIGSVLGVNEITVRRDLTGATNVAPAPEFSRTRVPHPLADEPDSIDRDVEEAFAAVNTDTGEIAEPEPAPARTIGGLDGKTYKIPEPKKPQRRALTETAHDIGWEIRKVTEKLQRLTNDDRFNHNKEEVAAHLRSHLQFTIESCQGILDVLNQSRKD